jgi:hypothetical protein
MKSYRWVIFGVASFLVVAVVCYLWATGLMDSLYAFRSPFKDAPLPAGEPVGSPASHRVVAILVDALRVDTAANKDVMPYLNQLRADGASATIHSSTPSYSFPGWSVLMTGAWQDLSDGPAMNPNEGEEAWTWTQDNVFTSVHNAGMKTAFSGTYFFPQVIPANSMDASFLVYEETVPADEQSTAEAVKFIQSGEYQFILVHINQVDFAGHHEGGPRNPNWNAAATRADKLIEQIGSALDFKQDTIIIFSDHGQIDAGGHGGQDPIVLLEPLIIRGAGVKPGEYGDVNQTDIAPTITTLLGANIPAVSQGHILTQMLTLNDEQIASVRGASLTQQKQLYEAYGNAIGEEPAQIKIDPNQDAVDIFQPALSALRNNRLNQERVPRFFLAGLLAFIPAYFLITNRSKKILWFILGTILYLAIFHLRYAVLQGRTYSLSSVLSSSDIINSTAVSTAIAFFAAWLVVSIALRIFSEQPLQAANTYIAFAGTLLYLVALPALWSYAYNDAFVTWTLPDMASMFMGFISILQMLIIAVLGIIFTGITPLLSLAFRKRN